MAASGFDRENILGRKLTKMDRQELCAFISDLCRTVVAEVGSRGRRGGIYPDNISVDAKGAIALGPAGRSPWDGQELNFVAPEQYWNGPLSAASDVYAVGLLMYYALNDGKLPLEGECGDPQLRRMGGGNPRAPKSAGRRLGAIIEKAIRFKASERYQTLEELRAVVDSCVKNQYLNGVPSAEAIFKKSGDDLSDVERMMANIIEKNEDPPAEDDDFPTEPPEDGVKVYKPAPKGAQPKDLISPAQADLLAKKMKSTSSPASPKLDRRDDPALDPVTLEKNAARSSPAVQYKINADRERKIAEEVKKRRRRPLAVILVLCAVLVMVAILMNAMLKDFEEARSSPDNRIDPAQTAGFDPMNPAAVNGENGDVETGFAISYDDFNNSTPGPSVTMEPVEIPADVEVPREHGYQLFTDDCSWTDAQKKCEGMGGHLVAIDSEDEFEYVIALAEDAGLSRVWIGMHRVNGEYLWDGKGAEYEGFIRWARGEPTFVDVNDEVAEDYIMIWDHNGWACNDNRNDPCHDYPDMYSGTMGYVCEFND
ncbi:MAG: hypothetical protein IKS25_04510 [Oscillospiraceae bacterium]|nr:hypothetical protein [Oscillospiraceae bacterium]